MGVNFGKNNNIAQYGMFYNNNVGVKKVIIPSSVKRIEDWAFWTSDNESIAIIEDTSYINSSDKIIFL